VKEELLTAGALPEERRLQVAALLRRDARVRVDDLAEHFAVSGETIRRDLKALEDRGIARRVYGGAMVVDADGARHPLGGAEYPGPDGRAHTGSDEAAAARRAMAAAAAALTQPGETIIFDLGADTDETARALPLTFTGRVLCASLPTAALLASRDGVEVHLAGGRLRRDDLVCVDDAAAGFFDRFFAHRAFLAADGVDPRAGLTCQNLDEIAVRRAMLRQAAQSYALADATKLGTIAVGRVAALSALAGVITDDRADPATVRALEAAGTRVIIAPPIPEHWD
jgi:DeoR family transcriptional regulator, fructose operon transcriptional repressor